LIPLPSRRPVTTIQYWVVGRSGSRLSRMVVSGAPGPAAEAFTTIGDLMRGQVVPPQVSAALFRAAALIPGVTVVPDAMDAAGRPGVAVAFDSHSRLANGRSEDVRQEWVFNKSTLQFMGEGTVADGIVTSASAVLDRGFVDRLGEVPPGTRS
jgi:hypothetical protein